MEHNKIKVKGTHILSVCKIKNNKAKFLERMLENVKIRRQQLFKLGCASRELLCELWQEYNYYLQQLHREFLVNQIVVENITTTVGRAVFAQRLSGDNTYTGNVNYCALGTNNAAPVVGNTQLGTETYRKALSSGADSNNICYLENFFTATEVTGTFEEYGFFIDGTGAANSGQLFNRFIQTIVKTNTESLNVQSTITFNDA